MTWLLRHGAYCRAAGDIASTFAVAVCVCCTFMLDAVTPRSPLLSWCRGEYAGWVRRKAN